MAELKGLSAGEDEKRHMMDILQRLHLQEVEGGGGGSSEDEGSEDEAEEGGLSQQTLHRLLAKVRVLPWGRPGCCLASWACTALGM